MGELLDTHGGSVDARQKAFMLHSVVPQASTLGCCLYDKTLKYCNTINNTSIWLLGDAANAYPANESLERNFKYLLDMLPGIYYNYFSDSVKYIVIDMDLNYILENIHLNSKCLKEYDFNGGYLESDYLNNNTKTKLDNIINQVFPKNKEDIKKMCSIEADDFKTFYNISTFLSFIINMNDILCNNSMNRSKTSAYIKINKEKSKKIFKPIQLILKQYSQT
jgi:hypothetical protein